MIVTANNVAHELEQLTKLRNGAINHERYKALIEYYNNASVNPPHPAKVILDLYQRGLKFKELQNGSDDMAQHYFVAAHQCANYHRTFYSNGATWYQESVLYRDKFLKLRNDIFDDYQALVEKTDEIQNNWPVASLRETNWMNIATSFRKINSDVQKFIDIRTAEVDGVVNNMHESSSPGYRTTARISEGLNDVFNIMNEFIKEHPYLFFGALLILAAVGIPGGMFFDGLSYFFETPLHADFLNIGPSKLCGAAAAVIAGSYLANDAKNVALNTCDSLKRAIAGGEALIVRGRQGDIMQDAKNMARSAGEIFTNISLKAEHGESIMPSSQLRTPASRIGRSSLI
ncbi:MAG: hypothetical protein AAF153_01960 [Pseudomonadota bacterium]